jgi:hypothetical protein
VPKNIFLDVYAVYTRVCSLVALDDGEDLPIDTEGTVMEVRITPRGVEYAVDFDGSMFESSIVTPDEVAEVSADEHGFRAVFAPAENQWRWMNTDTSIIAGRGDTPEQARADAARRNNG